MQARPTFGDAEALIERLVRNRRPVVFLVGAPLTAPVGTTPGVPGVGRMVDVIGDRFGPRDGSFSVRRRRKAYDKAVADRPWSQRYQAAFDYLIKNGGGGVDDANEVIRDAVLMARRQPPAAIDPRALREMEADTDGWHLSPGVRALGRIAAGTDPRFGRAVLTTNFDPLIQVAVRAGGGVAHPRSITADAPLTLDHATGTAVAHLHGTWRDETMHTPRQLTVDRAALRTSLAGLLRDHTLVVMAYGGWHDIITETLGAVAADPGARPDIVWCFYGDDDQRIVDDNPALFAAEARLNGRLTGYKGIDCHAVLPELRRRLDREGQLIGRQGLCERLTDALDKQVAVQVIGEPYSKRSRLLRWAATRAREMDLHPVSINARALARPTPEALLRAIANGMGTGQAMDRSLRRHRAVPDADDAIRCLTRVEGACVLIDDADSLAVDGHGFTGGFFTEVRGMVEAGALQWVSVSRTPLGALFEQRGLTSQFLNNAWTVYAGALDRTEVEAALRVRLGPLTDAALAAAGTLPHLVYRLTDADPGEVHATLRDLATWAEGLCATWWDRAAPEQAVLKAIAEGLAATTGPARDIADDLCRRGLLVETDDGFALNGAVWTDYVRGR